MSEPEQDESDREKKDFFDDWGNIKKMIRVFLVCCAAAFLLDAVFHVGHEHKHLAFEEGEFPVEGWFGFYAVYGFVAYVLLVLIARQLRKVLMRAEDYYDR